MKRSSSTDNSGAASMASISTSAPGGVALQPKATQNNGNKQASGASRHAACKECRRSRIGCDSYKNNPCSNCVKKNLICTPTNTTSSAAGAGPSSTPQAVTAATSSKPSGRSSRGPVLGTFIANPQLHSPPAPLSPSPQQSSASSTKRVQARDHQRQHQTPNEMSRLNLTAQQQADQESRYRFDNSDDDDDSEQSERRVQLSLRGQWAGQQAPRGSMIPPQFHIPAGETATLADVARKEKELKEAEAAERVASRTHADIEVDEVVLRQDLERVINECLPPHQVVQLTGDDDLTLLPESTGGPGAVLLPSMSTPLTQLQLSVREAVSKNKKRRRPKKKVKPTANTENAIIVEADEGVSPTPTSSSAATSFQTVTIEDDDEEDETTTAASTPPNRFLAPKTGDGGIITGKAARNKKKKKGRKAQKVTDEDDGYISENERHYLDQPFLLCCVNIRVPHPVNDNDHGKFLDLSKRMAGKFPDELVVQAKNPYGVVWCDFPIIFGLSYHHKPSDDRGINWYGTDDWLSGDITEIMVQAPEVVSYVEAPKVEIECLVRQPHGPDFVCSGHDKHTFTLFEVQWQAQGEGKRREAIRKLCEATNEDFATFLQMDRVKRGIHL